MSCSCVIHTLFYMVHPFITLVYNIALVCVSSPSVSECGRGEPSTLSVHNNYDNISTFTHICT